MITRRRLAALLCLPGLAGCIADGLADSLEEGSGPAPDCAAVDCQGAACKDGICQTAGCGNAREEPELDEQCDAGARNGLDEEPCTQDCSLRHCGDGVVDAGLHELCDGAGCKASCIAYARCGDGELDPGEACDDGNDLEGDFCEASCTVVVLCGDGELDPGEACDDGNDLPGDGCEDDCRCSGPTAISTVWQTTLVLRRDGAVFAWGFLPQDAPTAEAAVPTQLLELPSAVEVAAGERLAAIRHADGRVMVLEGENGGGGFDGDPATPRPLVLPGRYLRVVAGLDHLLLLDTAGGVSALGKNDLGQLGVGRVGGTLAVPEGVVALPDLAEEIAAGKHGSLAILKDGTVWAWGGSWSGQTGVVGEPVGTPRQVATELTGCDRVRTSGITSFARCGGAWWGWGWDQHGQIETATGVAPESCVNGALCRPVPAPLDLPFEAVELAVGQNAVYALDDEGGVWGWGNGLEGSAWDALGIGSGEAEVRTPTRLPLPLPGPYSAIAGGFYTGAALHESGALFTTGDNNGGALGRSGSGLEWLEVAPLCKTP